MSESTFGYVCIDATNPEEAIAEWHAEVARRGCVGTGKLEVVRPTGGVPSYTVEGPIREVITAPDMADLDNWFKYHAPTPADVPVYEAIRDGGRTFAMLIAQNVPSSRERSLAFTALREAVMWANAGRACNPAPEAAVEVEPGQCNATYTIPAAPDHTIIRYRCTRPPSHDRGGRQHRDNEASGYEWADEDTDKRRGICTTCGHPTNPHNFSHPVTTGATGIGRNTQ